MTFKLNWIKPVKIFLDVIEPPLLTLGAAPQTAEGLSIFGVLHLIVIMLITKMAMVMTQTKSFLCDDCCVIGKV